VPCSVKVPLPTIGLTVLVAIVRPVVPPERPTLVTVPPAVLEAKMVMPPAGSLLIVIPEPAERLATL